MHYNFYFDETFHDEKITIKSSGINTLNYDKNDSYIGVFWGFPNCKLFKIEKRLHEIEEKYKNIFQLDGEFKSTTINKKYFTYGLHSFNKNTFNFYRDFFESLNQINPVIHVNSMSKIEMLLRYILSVNEKYLLTSGYRELFYYSLTKFIITYHNSALIESLNYAIENENHEIFINELINELRSISSQTKGIPRKERESPKFEELATILGNFEYINPISSKYNFLYNQNFIGFEYLMNELKIPLKKINLKIDNHDKTYAVAKKYSFCKIKNINSIDSISIRVADHLCGFIGRMMNSLSNELFIQKNTISDVFNIAQNELSPRKLLNEKWFVLNAEQFNLYKIICSALICKQQSYWTTMSGAYADQMCIFYCFINYINTYNDYTQYSSVSTPNHIENYNVVCIEKLESFYNSFFTSDLDKFYGDDIYD
ncbi:hypothetical protein [Anaerorhabdus sp.]|uniref:hypothetical protein n=1 Tax=Anaerorhabdus sp. TaxID=1872524 RepID=UPI002FC64884